MLPGILCCMQLDSTVYRQQALCLDRLIFLFCYSQVRIMKDLRHPNIVQFMGATWKPRGIVMQYMHRGSLFQLLHRNSKVVTLWNECWCKICEVKSLNRPCKFLSTT